MDIDINMCPKCGEVIEVWSDYDVIDGDSTFRTAKCPKCGAEVVQNWKLVWAGTAVIEDED